MFAATEVLDVELFERRFELHRPLRTARGTIDERLELHLAMTARIDGAVEVTGWGAAAPLAGWSDDTLSRARYDLTRVRDAAFAGESPSAVTLLEQVRSASARYAVSSAILDAVGQGRGEPLRRLIDPAASNTVLLNGTIGICTVDEAARAATRLASEGFEALKLKVGPPPDQAIQRIRAVRENAPDVALRLDANGSFDTEAAREFCESVAPFDIEYVEQPVAADELEALGALKALRIVPIAADESCLPLVRAHEIVTRQLADVLVLKPALLGSWDEVSDLIIAARRAGSKIVMTSSIDSIVGRTPVAQFAAALIPGTCCGLATGWLDEKIEEREEFFRDGQLFLGSGNGMGFGPAVRRANT